MSEPSPIAQAEQIAALAGELERTKEQFGRCTICGYLAWAKVDDTTEDCQFCKLREQIAQANAAAGEALECLEGIQKHGHLSIFSCPCPLYLRKAIELLSTTAGTSLLREMEQLRARESLHREYEQLLGNEINEICSLGYVHGWRSTRYEQGKQLREKLGIEEAK